MIVAVNCPRCGALITPKPDTDGYKCDYCHSVFFPGEDDDGVQVSAAQPDPGSLTRSCPVCSIPLVQASLAKFPLQYCTLCHGLLMPMKVLPELIETLKPTDRKPAVQTPPDHADLKRTVQCPQCHLRMNTHFYAGPGNVIIDSCGDCLLLWFDRGELTRIAHAPDEDDDADPIW
jgi:Zn-finger nucleic acid-binding protein